MQTIHCQLWMAPCAPLTGSNTVPTAVASGTTAGTAVYGQTYAQGPANITLAGGLSPYGIMGLGGNVWEWEETGFGLNNGWGLWGRGIRGGSWFGLSKGLSSSFRDSSSPADELISVGFRVASVTPVILSGAAVPEPGSMAFLLAGALVFG